jgi:hypothetical protein
MSIADGSTSSGKVALGTGDDLNLYHNGTDSYVENKTGDLYLSTTNSGDDIILYSLDDIQLQVQSGEDAIKCIGNGAVELYYNNSLKLHTVNAGVEIEGNLQVDGSGTSVTIQPTDGLINFGMDGRSSFVTGTNSCYIYSGSGASGSMPAGDLIIQSRSDQNRTIRFVTGSSPAQRMSIDSGGLKFGTDTADANALDDYEEGSWTPALHAGETCSVYKAKYTKIGRLVTAYCYIYNFSDFNGNNNNFNITGLPFNASGSNYHGGGFIGYAASFNYGYPLLPLVVQSSSTGYFHRQDGTTANWTYQDFHNTNNGSNGQLLMTFVYETS